MVKVVDSHHKVLVHWAEYRRSLGTSPRLVTLDHHTDTSKPFRRYIQQNDLVAKSLRSNHLGSDFSFTAKDQELCFNQIQNDLLTIMDFNNPRSIDMAIEKLNNDEHIIAAIKSDIISSALVIAHNASNTDLSTYLEHKIICRSVNEIPDGLGNLAIGKLKLDSDSVLESEFLDNSIAEFNKILESNNEENFLQTPYILDIDLDYFNTFKSIEPSNSQCFESLVQGAGLVTIATEPEYVKSCALESGLTSAYLLDKLINMIPSA
jgi:hypothetical protein